MHCPYNLLPGGIPSVQVGQAASPFFVLSGGQAFMFRPGPDRLRRDAMRLKRLLPKGAGFIVLGYGSVLSAKTHLDGLADSFASILRRHSEPSRLVGISYGGLVATRLAARHPDLVSRLVLVSSAATFSQEGLGRVRRQIDLASQCRYAELLSEFGGAFRRPWYNCLLKARLLARRRQIVSEMNAPHEIIAHLGAALAADAPIRSYGLNRITARTLVIGGECDQFFGAKMSETADAISNARLRLISNETHMAPVERASEFRREIASFLDDSGNHMMCAGGEETQC